jgi:hypothetical protein
MPGDVKFEARVAPLALAHPGAPFDWRIPLRCPTKGAFLATFLGLFGLNCTQKPVRFERFKKLSPLFAPDG